MGHKQSIYETVPIGDEIDESRSSTEVDESLIGDEEQWKQPSRQRRRPKSRLNRCFSTFQLWRWVIDTCLLVVILVLLLLLRTEWRNSHPSWRQVGGDYTGSGPQSMCVRERETREIGYCGRLKRTADTFGLFVYDTQHDDGVSAFGTILVVYVDHKE